MVLAGSPSCAPSLHGHYPSHRYYGRSDCPRRCSRISCGPGSRHYPMPPSPHPCSNHPSTSMHRRVDTRCNRAWFRLRAEFAQDWQAPQVDRPNRVHAPPGRSGLRLHSRRAFHPASRRRSCPSLLAGSVSPAAYDFHILGSCCLSAPVQRACGSRGGRGIGCHNPSHGTPLTSETLDKSKSSMYM